VLAAIEAGCDAVDGALDAMSGLTSQPNLSAIAAALAGSERDPGIDFDAMQRVSHYWEGVRRQYAPFESDIRAAPPTSTATKCPAASTRTCASRRAAMGLDAPLAEVAQAYADVNQMFGDIVKVTPTSKVVGDMALMMVANGLSRREEVDRPRPRKSRSRSPWSR
jgi:pyruvate carboxylase